MMSLSAVKSSKKLADERIGGDIIVKDLRQQWNISEVYLYAYIWVFTIEVHMQKSLLQLLL